MNIVNKEIPLNSFTVSTESVKKIYRGLQRAVSEEADLNLAKWQILPDQTPEQFETRKKEVREGAFRVTVSVYREDGSHTYGSSEDLFDFSGKAPFVSQIYMTNRTAFQGMANTNPKNSFDLTLDFSQPPLLDAKSIVSSPTPNISNLIISGEREGWLSGVEGTVINQIDKRHTIRSVFHGPFIYDYGLILFGIPFSLYICWLSADFIDGQLSAKNQILGGAAYIYIVLGSVWAYRILFGYTKWAFPLVELTEQQNRPKKHRRFWWCLVALLVGKVFWDFFDPFLSVFYWIGRTNI